MNSKRGLGSLKAYFLMINLVVAMLAFSWMVGAEVVDPFARARINQASSTIDENVKSSLQKLSSTAPLPTGCSSCGIEEKLLVSAEKGELRNPTSLALAAEGGNRIGEVLNPTSRALAAENIRRVMSDIGKGEETLGALKEAFGEGPDTSSEGIEVIKSTTYELANKGEDFVLIRDGGKQYEVVGGKLYDDKGVLDLKGGGTLDVDKNKFLDFAKGNLKMVLGSGGLGLKAGVDYYLKEGLVQDFKEIGVWTGLGATIGGLIGGTKGATWGGIGGLSGSIAKGLATAVVGESGAVFGLEWLSPSLFGLIVTAAVIAALYTEESVKRVEFNCLPYQPPIGGEDCEKCNDLEDCTEYTCKSLGQACDLVDKGTENQKCIWKNPRDVSSPIMSVKQVLEDHRFRPDPNARPAGNGVTITRTDQECIRAFTPLEFTLTTDEPAQCKVDYNLTRGFDEMSYFIGGDSYFKYNHTEILSLPSPDSINKIAPELQNDGTYTLFLRCRDANGNFNQDPFSVRFCVEKGPDTTPPRVEDVNVPSGSPIQFNLSSLDIEVYVNEPSECKWSREDRSYDSMENAMDCDTNLWEMNNFNVYTCRTTLTGIENRGENKYYFKCRDQPGSAEGDRNTNVQSFLYTLIGTQPLTILEVTPFNQTIAGSTDAVPVTIEVKTDNGYEDGAATCYYSLTSEEDDYIEFLETKTNQHSQRQDLTTGDYVYFIKCVDLGGNTAYDFTTFGVESDKAGPVVVRAYKESGDLKIITSEKSECSYSFVDCNFNIEDGIKMRSLNYASHNTEWRLNKEYYVRCKDQYDNQPNPNTCSVIVKLYRSDSGIDVIEL